MLFQWIVGVDPGARNTGLTLLEFPQMGGHRSTLHESHTIENAASDFLPLDSDYVGRVKAEISELTWHATTSDVLIAIEGVTRPTWNNAGRFGGAAIDPGPLLSTAMLVGVLDGAFTERGWPILIVPPNHHGGGALASYPESLVSDAEKRRRNWQATVGGDKAKLRHERSAYDVAIAAHRINNLEQSHG